MGDIVQPWYPPGDVLRYGINTTPGTTDMTAAIQAALDGNSYVKLQPSVVHMCGMFNVWSNTIFDLNGGTIKLLPGVGWWEGLMYVTPVDTNGTYWDAARETATVNVTVKNGTLDGNIAGNPDPQAGTYTRSGDRGVNGIHLLGVSSNLHFENLKITGFFTDGCHSFFPGSAPTATAITQVADGVSFHNCDFDGNGRQGFAHVGGHNFTFVDCKFRNTYNAALLDGPWAGADIEPFDTVTNTKFIGCDFTGNGGRGLTVLQVITSALLPGPVFTDGLLLDDCFIDGNGTHTPLDFVQLNVGAKNGQGVKNVVISNVLCNGLFTLTPPTRTRAYFDVSVENSKFDSVNSTNPDTPALLVRGWSPGSRVSFNHSQFISGRASGSSGAVDIGDMNDVDLSFSDCEIVCTEDVNGQGILQEGGGTIRISLNATKIVSSSFGIDWGAGNRSEIVITGGSEIITPSRGISSFVGSNPYTANHTLSGNYLTGQTTFTLTAAPYFEAGDTIGIELNGGTIHWSTVASIPDISSTSVTISTPITLGANTGNDVYKIWTDYTTLTVGEVATDTVLAVAGTTMFAVGDRISVMQNTAALYTASVTVVTAGVSITVDGAGLAADAAAGLPVMRRHDTLFRVGDAIIRNASTGIFMNAYARAQSKGTEFVNCTANTAGLTERSELYGSGVPTMSAGNGSIYYRTDGTNGDNSLYMRIAGAWVPLLGQTA